jgi:hypothetical protein
MNDMDLEHALRDWMTTDVEVGASARLRARVISIPDRSLAQRARGFSAVVAALRSRPLVLSTMVAALVLLFGSVLVGRLLLGPVQVDRLADPGALRVVAQDGSGEFETISEAVRAADDGDMILVRPGTYVESIRIQEDITLRGDGDRRDIVIRSPSEQSDRWLSPEERAYAIWLEKTDARVETMTLTGPASALVIAGGSPRISDMAIIDVGVANRGDDLDATRFAGLALVSASTAEVRDSLFRRSDVAIAGSSVALLDNELESSMIRVLDEAGEAADLPPSLISGNIIRDPSVAIWVDGGSTARIEGNDISGADDAGAWIRNARPGTAVEGNSIRDSRTAIMVNDSSVEVSDNDVSGNQFGLNLAGTGSQVRGNRIRDNTVGVLISASSPTYGAVTALTMEGNTIEGNERGLSIKAGTSADLVGNVVCDNETNVDIVDGADVTLTDNRICPDVLSTPAP